MSREGRRLALWRFPTVSTYIDRRGGGGATPGALQQEARPILDDAGSVFRNDGVGHRHGAHIRERALAHLSVDWGKMEDYTVISVLTPGPGTGVAGRYG